MSGSRKKTLIFPSSVPAAQDYARAARERGEAVVAASSLEYDETANRFETWFRLPSVYAPEFAAKLHEAIETHDIGRIFAPVSGAHWAMSRMATEGRLQIAVLGDMPVVEHAKRHAALMAGARMQATLVATLSEGRSTLTEFEIAAVLGNAMHVFGESNESKLAAILAIFADAPAGDIVEIGVLTGRSAAVLEQMAKRYETGAVLAIDPWQHEHSVQHDSPAMLQSMVDVWDAKVPFETFILQLLPIARKGRFNYLAQTSDSALAAYRAGLPIVSPEFGSTRYEGSIAVLHIDGNHDHDAVSRDCANWIPLMKAGSWLILDDYVWLHGDGPQRAGDALLLRHAAKVARAFVCGKALFIQWKTAPVG